MPQLEHIDAIERRLWSAADTLRANSQYASNEYFLPVMGLVFLRHAYSRYLAVRDEIAAGLPKRGGRTRALTREDFSRRSALFLQLERRGRRPVVLHRPELDRNEKRGGVQHDARQHREAAQGVEVVAPGQGVATPDCTPAAAASRTAASCGDGRPDGTIRASTSPRAPGVATVAQRVVAWLEPCAPLRRSARAPR